MTDVTEQEAFAEFEAALEVEAERWGAAALAAFEEYDAKQQGITTFVLRDTQRLRATLDALQEKGVASLRDALEECRDALLVRVRRSGDLAALSVALERLPRFGAVEGEVRAMLDRAWEAGSRDARREVREGRRNFEQDAEGNEGVWRTIRGRRVFIREGQSLDDALRESFRGKPQRGEHRNDVTIYHGTLAKNIASIRKEGIRGPAYVTQSKGLAEAYSNGHKKGGLKTALFTLRVPKGEWGNFKKGFGSEFISSRKIPPEWITEVTQLSDDFVTVFCVVLVDEGEGQAKRDFAGTDSSFSPKAATRWLRATAFWVSGILGDRVLADAKAVILNGLKTGKATQVIAEELLTAFLPWLGDPDVIADEKQLEPYRLETIVRTNTTTAYNHGRLTEFFDPDIVRFLKGVRYSAILDERTCFARGTEVWTTKGLRPIESLRPGDEVISGAGQRRRVRALKIALAWNWRRVGLEDGQEIDATATHPFWSLRSEGACWVELQKLSAGDRVGTVDVPQLQQAFSPLREREEKEALFVGVSSGSKKEKGFRAAEMSVLRQGVLHETDLRRAGRGAVLFEALHEKAQAAGDAKESNPVSVHCLSQALSYQAGGCSAGGLSEAALFPGVPQAEDQRRLPDLWKELRDRSGESDEVLLGLVLSGIVGGDETGSCGADGAGGVEPSFSAGGRPRTLLTGLSCCREGGYRGQREVLASENERTSSAIEEESNCSGRLHLDHDSGRQGRLDSEGRSAALPDHGVRPTPTGEATVASCTPSFGWRVCYDVEVEGDHSYLVGRGGLIAHNTEVCRFLDGKVFRPSDPNLEALLPPNHYQCRSIIVPIVAGERVDEADFITPEQIGEARGLADPKFLTQAGDAWKAYREKENAE